MSYPAEAGRVSATYHPAEDTRSVRLNSGTLASFVAPGSATEGEFGLFRWDMPAGSGGPAAHFHRTFSESFYVLAGTVRLFGGTDWVEATAGDFLYVPRGGVHAFRNDSADPASMLILFAPGAPRERYFDELAEIGAAGRTLSYDEWTELFARHDQYRAEP
ncbi:MAG TPA: cupin domain-containing protein [Pseudonocardiaceae bacterium]|jgi:quercetin dioxygenase-like cupin family protein|nr:cupin domain-containing protein [Pseudonocardiaceae bacterium]